MSKLHIHLQSFFGAFSDVGHAAEKEIVNVVKACTVRERECCTSRPHNVTSREEMASHRRPGSQANLKATPRANSHPGTQVYVEHLPDDFFIKLATDCVEDPHIAAKIEDDRTSQIIWGEAHSLRFLFLQMCIRDRHERCKEIWPQLSELDRRDYMSVYHHGQPTGHFFLDILKREQEGKETSDCGSNSGLSINSVRSQYNF